MSSPSPVKSGTASESPLSPTDPAAFEDTSDWAAFRSTRYGYQTGPPADVDRNCRDQRPGGWDRRWPRHVDRPVQR